MAELILDRYKVTSQAGTGAFGTVYVAWDTRIQRKVAIKCIEISEMDSALDEARTAALLSDQNIVAVYDFEVQDHTAYLIMEYVEGLTLTELLRDFDDELTLDIIAAVFNDVAHALTTAHDNQVLHLDIKPDNILINRNGQVKVTDFGLATLADAQGFGSAGGGTIGYMPPEQMRQQNLDARCDEWALASIVYEMISGTNPFVASDLKRAQAVIEEAELVLPSLCWEGVDEGIDDVIFTALDPDREERWQTVADFADELMPYLGDAEEGHAQLARIVNGEPLEEDEEDVGFVAGLLGKLGIGRAQQLEPAREDAYDGEGAPLFYRTSHVFSAASAAFLVVTACLNMPFLPADNLLILIAIGVISAIFGAWKEHLAPLLGMLAWAVAFLAHRAYGPGFFLLAVTPVWWWFVGRRGVAQANSLVAFPVLGAFGGAPIAALASGATLPPIHALVNVVFGSAIAFIMAGFGSGTVLGWYVPLHHTLNGDVPAAIVTLLQDPIQWIIVASWCVAALVAALLGLPRRRWLSLIGAILGAAALIAGAVIVSGMFPADASWQQQAMVWVPTILAALGVTAAVFVRDRIS